MRDAYTPYILGVRLKEPLPEYSYIAGLPCVKALEGAGIEFKKPVTFFMGENGSGKSTLLEAIAAAYGFNPEGGGFNFGFSTSETHSQLCRYITISKKYRPRDGYFLRAESFYNLASEIDRIQRDDPRMYDAYGGKSLHEMSHGESFITLMQNRFGNGLYILDEPEAALSPTRIMTMMTIMHERVKKGAQFIISTHSPILSAYPDADIYVLDENGARLTEYEDTEHYRVTKMFLNDTERMLGYLLG